MPTNLMFLIEDNIHFILVFLALILVLSYLSLKSKNKTIKIINKILESDITQLILIVLFLVMSFSFFHELGHFLTYLNYEANPSMHFGFDFKDAKSYLIHPLFYVDHTRDIGIKEERIAALNGNFFSAIYIFILASFLMAYKFWRGSKKEGKFIHEERDYFEIVITSMIFVFIFILILNMNPYSMVNDMTNIVNGP